MHLGNLESIITTIGYAGIYFIVFAESGLFFGFFLPGDSLLFTAGFLASQNLFNIWFLLIGCVACAVLGVQIGYIFGHKFGKRLFHKKDSLFFHKENLERTKRFYNKHGKKTIVIARFMPVIRTFAPIVAGIVDMDYKTFLWYNIVGGVLWAGGLTLAGYYLGKTIPDVDRYLLPIIGLVILLSVLPSAVHVLKDKKNRKKIFSMLAKPFGN